MGTHGHHALQGSVRIHRILGNVCLERNLRAFDKHHSPRFVVGGGVPVVGIVEPGEVRRDTDRIATGFDVGQHTWVPHALLALAVRAVAIQVAKLSHECALANAGPAHDGYAH